MVRTAASRAPVWRYGIPRAAAMVLWLPVLLWIPLDGVSDPAGAFPPPRDVADIRVSVDQDGDLYVSTVVAWEQDGRIGPVTEAVAASIESPTPADAVYPVSISNQGQVTARAAAGDTAATVAVDLERLRTELASLGFEQVQLCVSTPHLVDSVVRADLPGLRAGCAEFGVDEPIRRVEVEVLPDAGQSLWLVAPLVAAVVLWLLALVGWMRKTSNEPASRASWPMVASIVASLLVAFFVFARSESVGLAWGLEPWQEDLVWPALYLLVLLPGILALWPLGERRDRRRLDALPPPPSGGPAGPPASPALVSGS